MAGNYSNTGSWVPQVNTVGLRNVGSYQVSGTPWITGSTIQGSVAGGGSNIKGEFKVSFPRVTKSIEIRTGTGNTSLFFGFQSLEAMGVSAPNGRPTGAFPAFCVTQAHRLSLSTPDNPSNAQTSCLGFNMFQNDSILLNVGVKEIYLWLFGTFSSATMDFTIVATLTDIPSERMYHLTGSGITTFDTSP